MRSLIIGLGLLLVVTGGWFVTWKSMMADDVAFIESAVKQRYDIIKAVSPHTTFKVDAVYATGFPFKFRVAVHRPTLTQISNGKTYAISFDKMELARASDARFDVFVPQAFDAMYAKAGAAPEQYRISLNEVPPIWLEGEKGALTKYGVLLPRKLLLDVALNGKSSKIGFDFPLALPISANIPADASAPLQIFVGMLREAMVYSAP